MIKYLNESLPKQQRLGQIGMSNTYGKMKIIRYENNVSMDIYFEDYDCIVKNKAYDKFLRGNVKPNLKKCREGKINLSNKNEKIMVLNHRFSKDVDVIFLHNWGIVHTNYDNFLRGKVNNPLYYKERYEGQIRKANNGQWMKLLIWNDAMNCVVEFEDGTLVDCSLQGFLLGHVGNPNKEKDSENEFYFDCDLNCWVGVTNKDNKFYFSHPDKKMIEYIKSFTWYINYEGYAINTKVGKLHRVIMNCKDEAIQINHIGGNKLDNRLEKLEYSDSTHNSKEKVNRNGKIVGLRNKKLKSGGYSYWGESHINGKTVSTKRKYDENEALIDLLIVQRKIGLRHNQDLWNLLNDISPKKINGVLDLIDKKVKNQKQSIITKKNKFERNKLENFYNVYDYKNLSFKIDINNYDKVNSGIWQIYQRKYKSYVQGNVIIDGIRKKVSLHRYLYDICNDKYSKFCIDHINGDSLDNRVSNLIITERKGNGLNYYGRGYTISKSGLYNVGIRLNRNLIGRKSFKTKEESVHFYKHYKQILMKGRLQWQTKEELDKWIERVESKGEDIEDVINEHYKKLYQYVSNLIDDEYPRKYKASNR